ncbi:MAG: efflux RND transporter periplasmic adaptor subunit [Chromatiaceae bacterium]
MTAEEALENAGTQLDVLSAQLEAQRSQVEVAEAEVQVAQVGYDNTILRAPFSGVVVAKTAQPGEIVSPSSAGGGYTRTGIGTIVDMASLEIEVDVNEAYINRVKPGQPVQAVLDAYPDWKIPAAVIAIIPTADRSKATVKVRIAVKEKDPRILPDMGVRVSFAARSPSGRVWGTGAWCRWACARASAWYVIRRPAWRTGCASRPAPPGPEQAACGRRTWGSPKGRCPWWRSGS